MDVVVVARREVDRHGVGVSDPIEVEFVGIVGADEIKRRERTAFYVEQHAVSDATDFA